MAVQMNKIMGNFSGDGNFFPTSCVYIEKGQVYAPVLRKF